MLDRICDNCMSRVPAGVDRCPKCGIRFENTNPGGALPNGWVLGERYTIGRYIEIDGEGVTYSAIDANTLQRVTVKEFMPVTLCSTRDEIGAIIPKPGCEVLFKTTRMDYTELYRILLRMGFVEGLVQVLDVLEENNTAYAVLEKIEGPTLKEYLTKTSEPMESSRALAMLRPLMMGVAALHSASVIHRGISPDNIILESGGTAKLGGFATLALRQQGSELKPKLYPGYSAPEQYAASEFEGRYTDVYSFGAVLYRMVTGEAPISADERKMQDTMRNARAMDKNVPAFLSTGISRAMRIVPAERIQSIPDLRLALSGEGGRTAKGPLGLSRQQLIVGAAALGTVVVIILVILIVSIFSGDKDKDSSSSSSSSSSSTSVSVAANMVPDFVGKVYADVVKGSEFKDLNFATPEEAFSQEVEEGRIISQTPAAGQPLEDNTSIKFVVSKGPEAVAMPDFVTRNVLQADAEKQLKELNILYVVETRENKGDAETGTVVETSPVAGTQVIPNKDKVTLYVAGEVALITMPDLVGKTEADAKAALTRLGISYANAYEAENDQSKDKNGLVASTDPAAGTQITTSTNVSISVYRTFVMPDLDSFKGGRGQTLKDFLDQHKIPWTEGTTVETTDAGRFGMVADIEYVRNSEVTSSTLVTIHLFVKKVQAPLPETSSTGE